MQTLIQPPLLREGYSTAGGKQHRKKQQKQALGVKIATFSTSVGLAMVEDMTPERIPQITLVSKVSSER